MLNDGKKIQTKSIKNDFAVTKSVKSSKAIKASDSTNAFYIINYEGGGFAIISGDRRTQKVLAFSDKNEFNIGEINSGIAEWLNTARLQIEEIRSKNIAYTGQDKIDIFKRSNTNSNKGIKNIPIDTSCTGWTHEVLPLLQTMWSQNAGYNNMFPLKSCTPADCNGHAFTGCVPTAMAQVMRYYEYPTTYNYSIMQNTLDATTISSSGANEISRLMLAAAGAVSADMKCDVT